MGLSESSLNTVAKPFSFYHIVKYHVIVHRAKTRGEDNYCIFSEPC